MDGSDFDPQLFLAAMGNVASSVMVVTTYTDNGEPTGLTVSAFSSVSLEPPLVLACVGIESNSLEALRSHSGFTVNFLATGTDRTAMRMAARDTDKLVGVPWHPPSDPVAGPVLSDVNFCYFECRKHLEVEAGDHWVFIGEVVAGEILDDRDPLVYHRRAFVTLTE